MIDSGAERKSRLDRSTDSHVDRNEARCLTLFALACGLAFLLAFALGASALVAAQTFVCPGGPGPGEVQDGTSGGGNGVAAVPICAPAAGDGGGGAGASQTTYESFAIHPDVDDVWMAGNRLGPFAAELYAKKRKGQFDMQATYDSSRPGLVVHDFTIEVTKP